MTMDHDLLAEPLLSWRDCRRKRAMATLPGILARLAAGELGDYPRLRAHQFHPWSMTLTQLAAIALKRASRTDPRVSEDAWRTLLLALTGQQHEPWCLVVQDLSKPAFFQPPVPAGVEEVASWKISEHADDMDVLETAKAHDIKNGLIRTPAAEPWVYALVTLQTSQGYSGGAGGYKGVCRMNGGYGSRARVGLSPDQSLGARFLREVAVLLETWPALLERGFRDDGVALTWAVDWDGASTLGAGDLAPHFVEICRRVRMRRLQGGLICAYTTARAKRCLQGFEKGDIGDPWIPIKREEGTALTIKGAGFNYSKLTELLFGGDYEPAPAQLFRSDDGATTHLVLAALARGQNKTEGLHERTLVLAGEVRRRLGQPQEREALGRRATRQLQQAERIRAKVLFPALKLLASGGKPLPDALEARVDEVFFTELFRTISLDDEEARLAWERRLVELARDELRRAVDRCSLADAQRYRSIAGAEALFEWTLRKHFPDAARKELAMTSQDQQGAQP